MSLPQSPEELRGLCVDDVGMGLLRAAEIIREKGLWKQGRSHGASASRCIVLATNDACGSNRIVFSAWDRLKKHFGVSELYEIYAWNDAPERTADEVIAALTQAAFASTPCT